MSFAFQKQTYEFDRSEVSNNRASDPRQVRRRPLLSKVRREWVSELESQAAGCVLVGTSISKIDVVVQEPIQTAVELSIDAAS